MKILTPFLSSRRPAGWRIGVCALVLGLLQASLSAQGGGGSITGRVVNQATGAPLQGASVVVPTAGSMGALTEADGSFRLVNVPPGEHRVVVDYTGLETGRVQTNVSPGGAAKVNIELTSGIYRMSAFSVSAVREGQASAINQQRIAPNVQ